MYPKIAFLALLAALVMAACAGAVQPGSPDEPVGSPPDQGGAQPTTAPWEPAAGDEDMSRGEVFVDTQDILVLESFPPQFVLALAGSLPTPCNQLRVRVSDPDAQNRILVEVYSLVDPGQACIQVLEPFEANVPLGSFASGEFTVLINGQEIGQITP
ncbi:MAG TPA: hypothetical protein VJ436_11360 [Anaerolineales bacterium]|nr:hypothetical protein [Anaerolineales bacterium]